MQRDELIQAVIDSWGPLKRAVHQYFMQYYAPIHLSPVQLELLKTIHHCQPLSHKELAQRMQLTPGAISQQLEGLESTNLIERTLSPDDRRVSYLTVSPAGQEKLEEFRAASRQLFAEALSTLSDDELAAYIKAQDSLKQHLEQHTHKTKED